MDLYNVIWLWIEVVCDSVGNNRDLLEVGTIAPVTAKKAVQNIEGNSNFYRISAINAVI